MREPEAKLNGHGWLDAADWAAVRESRFDDEVRRGVKWLVSIDEQRGEMTLSV